LFDQEKCLDDILHLPKAKARNIPHFYDWLKNITDRSVGKTTDQITNPRAIPSVEAATLQIFRAFRAFRGQKMPFCVVYG
jgi:hypothetical protein